jgi:hypothetical protein
LANQWEFPSCALPVEAAEADNAGAEEDNDVDNDAFPTAAAAPPSLDTLWTSFQAYFASQLQAAWDANSAAGTGKCDVIKTEHNMETDAQRVATRPMFIETASMHDFPPIVHVFSHQRHTMHIVLKDVVVLGEPALDAPVTHQWMSATEIVAAGITTGCKKILMEVTKKVSSATAASKPKNATKRPLELVATKIERAAKEDSPPETVAVLGKTEASPVVLNAFDILKGSAKSNAVAKPAPKKAKK